MCIEIEIEIDSLTHSKPPKDTHTTKNIKKQKKETVVSDGTNYE